MKISTRALTPAFLAIGLVVSASAAQAAPLLSDAKAIGAVSASASSNYGAPFTIGKTINQSDLSGSYVSGVTSADTVGGYSNENSSEGWHGAYGVTTGTIVYDLGSQYTLDRVYLFWMNAGDENNIAALTVDVSTTSNFAQFSTVGSLAMPTGPKDQIDFSNLATGQYVRLNWSALQGSFPGLNEFVAGGVSAAVPETATWGMMIAGFGMMGAAMRTRRRSTTVSFA